LPGTGVKFLRFILIVSFILIGCRTVQPDENYHGDLSCEQRSLEAEEYADSLLHAGSEDQAREAYLRAALLRNPDDFLRAELVRKAAASSDSPSILTAQMLLENPDSLAPYRALELGGAGIGREILSCISRDDCVMPEYIRLALADSLLNAGKFELALTSLGEVPADLPDRAQRSRTVLYFRAFLGTDQVSASDSLLNLAENSPGEDELLSMLYHYRGMWMLDSDIPGYETVLLRSFELWPAAPVHAAAYNEIRTEMLSNRGLSASAADPFYGGGGSGTNCTISPRILPIPIRIYGTWLQEQGIDSDFILKPSICSMNIFSDGRVKRTLQMR